MQVIQHIELGSSAANITFSSIPQTYTDLVVVCSLRSSDTGDYGYGFVRPNGATTNTSSRLLYGLGNSSGSASYSTIDFFFPSATTTSNTFSNMSVYFPNYRVSAPKSVSVDVVTENNGTIAVQVINAGLWNDNAAITSVVLAAGVQNFVAGSSATLYGITSGSSNGVTVS